MKNKKYDHVAVMGILKQMVESAERMREIRSNFEYLIDNPMKKAA